MANPTRIERINSEIAINMVRLPVSVPESLCLCNTLLQGISIMKRSKRKTSRDLTSFVAGTAVGGVAGAVISNTYKSKDGLFILPPYHVPACRVPHGGSSCANCKYVYHDEDDKPHCKEPGFILWNGGTRIPVDDARDYCSDWWIAAPGAFARARK